MIKKILLTFIGILLLTTLAIVMPESPSMAYPPGSPVPPITVTPKITPSSPLIICGDGYTEHFRVYGANCDGAYLWYGNRPPFYENDEIFVYAESVAPSGWSLFSPAEFITWTNNGELFYNDLDRDFMAGKYWYIRGWIYDNEFNQYICETENTILVDCIESVPKSKLKLPMIFKYP